jgi:hypothetical protein
MSRERFELLTPVCLCLQDFLLMARAEVSESAFEYLLCEILALDPPDAPDLDQVKILLYFFLF